MGDLRLALIIPTCGRPHDLAACLQSIDDAAGSELTQLIVVDDAPWSPAAVPERIAEAEVCLFRNPNSIGAAASRNKGLALLGSDVNAVGFLDDDVRLRHQWFAVLRGELKPERGAITGPIHRFDAGVIARARQLRYDARYRALQLGSPVDFLAGGNTVFWRATLGYAGGFPATETMSDTLLARRLEEVDTPCHFVPELVVLHRNSKGARQACLAAWRAGSLEGRQGATTYFRRLLGGARTTVASPDPMAAAVNVLLDAVFLVAHATSRVLWLSRRRRPSFALGSPADLSCAPQTHEPP